MATTKEDFIEWNLIGCELNSLTGSTIVTVFECNPLDAITAYQSTNTSVRVNGYIENFNAKANLDATYLAEVAIPVFDVDSSANQRAMQQLLLEHNSPRKQLDIYVSHHLSNWFLVDSVSLLNPMGFPYFKYNLQELLTDNLSFKLGKFDRVGVGISDVGWGRLQGNDSIIIYGTYGQETILITKT